MIIEFIKYLIKSKKNARGVHSDFFYNFVIKVLKDFQKYNNFEKIEKIRKKLINNPQKINVLDLGAGSKKIPLNQKKTSKIAKFSLTSSKYSRLLFSLANYTNSKVLLELGTSFGLTTLYFNECQKLQKIITVEGSQTIAEIAAKNFNQFDNKIELYIENFDDFLLKIEGEKTFFDFIYIDGNHTKEATLRYYEFLKKFINKEQGVIIFDDIRWSKEMLEAWKIIKKDKYSTVDLFKMGIVFFNKNLLQKQDLILYY